MAECKVYDACPVSTLIHDTTHQICLGADAAPFDIELRWRNSFQPRLEPKRSEAWDFKQEKNLCYNPTTCIPQNDNIQKKHHIVTTTCRSPAQKRLLKTWTVHLCCLHLPGCRTLPWARYAPLRRPWQGLGLQKDLLSCPTQFRYVWLYDSTTHTCWTQIILSDWKFLKVLRTISIISFQMNSPLSPWLEVFSPIIAPQRWVRFWKGPL